MQHARVYLQLMRFPAVFTALADICLGWLLTHDSFSPAGEVVRLLGASAGMYLGGMVLNDLFDRNLDAVERPERPIPSGRVPLVNAVLLGVVLLVGGGLLAWSVGSGSRMIAACLIICIVAYDGFLKSTPVGPIAMGACRFLNVMLGASAASHLWSKPQWQVALALGLYVCGITWFAREEARAPRRSQLIGAIAVVSAALAAMAWVIVARPVEWFSPWRDGVPTWSGLAALVMIAAGIEWKLCSALRSLNPLDVRSGVRTMLLSLIALDATFIWMATGSVLFVACVLLLLVPAMKLGKWIFMT